MDPANVASISRYLVSTGMGLWALMMALQPDVGFAAPWPWMALFWALQIGAGRTVLQWVLYLLSRAELSRRAPLWFLVIVSGVAGSVVLAPVYWLIGEGLMERTSIAEPDTSKGATEIRQWHTRHHDLLERFIMPSVTTAAA